MTLRANAVENSPVHPIDYPVLFKESGLVALVVFGLAFSLLGFKLEDVSGGLKVIVRFGDVAIVTLIAFCGRAGLVLLRQGRQLPVMLTMLPFAAVLMSALLVVQISDAPQVASWLPFGGSPVMSWLLALLALSIGTRAGWLYWQSAGDNREQSTIHLDQIAARLQSVTRLTGPILLVIALLLPFFPFADRRVIDILILTVTYIMLGWGLNIVVGLAGLLDLGYVAFYAVGAYSYALLALHFDMGFWICLPFAGIMAAFAGILLGFPVLRLRGDYLAIVTLGFGEIVRVILLNWYTFTKGPDGISGIPRPSFFGLPFKRYPAEGTETFHSFFNLTYSPIDRIIFLYYVILLLALLTNLFTLRIRKLPIGRAWEALREDETACRSLGINPRNTKLTAFSIGAMFAGIGGSFFATRQGFISPESFTFIESAIILAIVVLGGMGSQIGVVFAAILLIGLPEFFRELHQYRMLAFGAAMIAIMVWRPKGLLVFRKPTISLFGRNRQ